MNFSDRKHPHDLCFMHVQAAFNSKTILNLTRSHNVRVYPKPVAGSQFPWGTTHLKISQLVASLQTSRQQVVFARLVTSCQQVWNKLLITCNNLVDIVRLVTRLFQQGCYNHDITILLQPCVVNLVTLLLYHVCIRLVRTTL